MNNLHRFHFESPSENLCLRSEKMGKKKKICYYVLIFTFLIYTMYHMSRKPFSVVKSVLNKNCTSLNSSVHHNNSYWCDWAPFGDTDASELLGGLDSSFLFSYAICMFFSGYLAERSNLRYYLTGGMLLSALSVFLFGLGDWLNIHSFAYYVVVMIVGGIFQTSGWPAVVTCVGNWFGKKKRGFIFGVWNSHTSFGNILGSYFAGLFVEYNWGYSFVVPAIIMASFAIIVFLFLTPYPEDVDCESPNHKSVPQKVELSFILFFKIEFCNHLILTLLIFLKLLCYHFVHIVMMPLQDVTKRNVH
ncbi:Glucose-6-phosphate exchanger SLC37A2 [Nymphon striatum]|nr:Glucose-6-phosphate exchanger SLC37A2 [Nymphon striatum]